jgi:CSLREA domain-containing protein
MCAAQVTSTVTAVEGSCRPLRPVFFWGVAAVAVLSVWLSPAGAGAATILPSTTADESTNNTTCSLREAVQAANTNSNAHEDACAAGDGGLLDEIFLGNQVTYTLTGAAGEDANVTGDLDVGVGVIPSGPLQITGRGTEDSIIDGDIDRAIHQLAGDLTLSALKIENSGAPVGNHPGGAIFAVGIGSLTLTDVQLTGNSTPEEGGAVATGSGLAALTIDDSRIGVDNVAGVQGGAIDAQSPLTMTNSLVDENRVDVGDGGGLHLTKSATVVASVIRENGTAAEEPSTAGGAFGGGIDLDPATSATLTLTGSAVTDNGAEVRGGGIHIADGGDLQMAGSTVSRNGVNNDTEADTDAGETGGGGIALDSAGASAITSSTIADNESSTTQVTVDDHGGILNNGGGTLTVRRSTVSGNSVLTGGAEEHGGGISNDSGTLKLVNSTISGNSASLGLGGGLDNDSTATIISSTFGDNSASDGHAINDQGTTTLGNSIIDDSNTTNTCTGPPTSTGNNVAVGTTCVDGATNGSDSSDLPNTSAALQALDDNGGLTQTHEILASSPALNHVPAAECLDEAAGSLTIDQRGAARPISTDCDSGAFERQTSAPAAPTVTGSDPASPANEPDIKIKGSAGAGTIVALYTDDQCTVPADSPSEAKFDDATFTGPGILVAVGNSSTTTFFATATNEVGTSSCSAAGFTYQELSNPFRPTFTGSSPASGANDNNPEIMGSVAPSPIAGSTVALFTNSSCTGGLAGIGTAAVFASPGITVTVPDNSTTTFFGQVSNSNGRSGCTLMANGLTYSEVTQAVTPVTPVPPITPIVSTPPATENPACAGLRKKLKKAETKKAKKKFRKKLRALGC